MYSLESLVIMSTIGINEDNNHQFVSHKKKLTIYLLLQQNLEFSLMKKINYDISDSVR